MLRYLRATGRFLSKIMVPIAPLTWLCVLSAAQLTEPTSNGARLQGLLQPTFANFQQAVLNGKTLDHCIIPSHYIEAILKSPLTSSAPNSSALELNLNSCRITGDLIQWESAPIPFSITISNSDFEPKLYLNNAQVNGNLTFEHVVFFQAVYFQGATFPQRTVFRHVEFRDLADFSGAHFLAELSCEECLFRQLGQFSHAIVTSSAKLIFTGQTIDSPMDFSGSKISGKVTFEGITHTLRITNKLYMSGINDGDSPRGELTLKNVEILDTLYLDQGNWARLDFAEMDLGSHRPIRFAGFADFRHTTFKTVDLDGAEFDGSADFSGATFLESVDLERIKIRKPVRIRWMQIQGKAFHLDRTFAGKQPFSKDTYEELKRNFKTLEDLESENACFYEMRQHYTEDIPWLFSWLMGHGVRWQNPFCFLAISFLLLALLNSRYSDGMVFIMDLH